MPQHLNASKGGEEKNRSLLHMPDKSKHNDSIPLHAHGPLQDMLRPGIEMPNLHATHKLNPLNIPVINQLCRILAK